MEHTEKAGAGCGWSIRHSAENDESLLLLAHVLFNAYRTCEASHAAPSREHPTMEVDSIAPIVSLHLLSHPSRDRASMFATAASLSVDGVTHSGGFETGGEGSAIEDTPLSPLEALCVASIQHATRHSFCFRTHISRSSKLGWHPASPSRTVAHVTCSQSPSQRRSCRQARGRHIRRVIQR